ncbi:PASTA domain-containing protein [Candidatus Saganbacteria bacterium]|nr:PASTA domain-containing protein [Candidatus Saganbacteria bacterium]
MKTTILIIILAGALLSALIFFGYFAPLPETTIPDVVGLSENEAVLRLERMGLKANIDSRNSQSNIVTGQRPEPGKTVKIGRFVSIDIGKSGVENPIPPTVVISPNLTMESQNSSGLKIEVINGGETK